MSRKSRVRAKIVAMLRRGDLTGAAIARACSVTKQRVSQIRREERRAGRKLPPSPARPSPRELTRRQEQVLRYVVRCIERNGYPPTCREIADHFGVGSTHTIQDHLEALERKGRIANRTGQSRTIRVLGVRWKMERIETT